jgi:hypothetical protein
MTNRKTTGLTIERVPWADLKPHTANARNGDVDAIAESVVENGVYRPIVCAKDGTILAGHHLYYALGQLGDRPEVDIVRLDVDPGSTEATKIMIADNRTADLGGYDDGLLLALLQSLDDTAGTGYLETDVTSLADLLNHTATDYDNQDTQLADEVERATWPTITIKEVPPDVFAIWDTLEGEPIDRLRNLLNT